MIFQPNTYSVLLVSASKKTAGAISSLLPAGEYDPVVRAGSLGEARRRMLEREFDLLLINSPLPDGPGIELAEDACAQTDAGVLLLTAAELFDDLRDRLTSGGVAALPKPTSGAVLSRALQMLCATRERLRGRRQRQATVEERMEEIRLVNRAKWLLISGRGLDEPAAHRLIEKRAMDRCASMGEIAREIIAAEGDFQ